MGNNNFTKTFSDGTALTEAELTTLAQSLTLDLSNTTQMTTGSTSGNFLKSNGDGAAASWGLPLDPLGPFAVRNYGLSTAISTGALVVTLKTNAAGTPSAGDPVDIPFSNNGATTATYTALQVTGALSFTITASATLGFTGTSTNRVFIYALNNTGTVRLGVSARSDLDTAATVTPVAMTSAADSFSALYATATTAVVARLLGFVDAALNSTKQWQTPSHCGVINQPGLNNAITVNQILDSGTRLVGTGTATLAVRNVAASLSSGTFANTGTTVTAVTNLSVSVTTSGRPVDIRLIGTGDLNQSYIQMSGTNCDGDILIFKDGTQIADYRMGHGSAGASIRFSPGSLNYPDTAASAGTHTYAIKVKGSDSTSIITINNCKLYVCEMP